MKEGKISPQVPAGRLAGELAMHKLLQGSVTAFPSQVQLDPLDDVFRTRRSARRSSGRHHAALAERALIDEQINPSKFPSRIAQRAPNHEPL